MNSSHSTDIRQYLQILPSEILSIIIENISSDVLSTVSTLIDVYPLLSKNLLLSLKYINRLSVSGSILTSNSSMLKLLRGVKHLSIHSGYLNLSAFSQNIWNNLESLSISSELASLLNTYSEDELVESFDDRMNGFESFDKLFNSMLSDSLDIKHEIKNPRLRKLEYSMPRLRILEITESNSKLEEHIVSHNNDEFILDIMDRSCLIIVNPDICPNLETLKMNGCQMYNIREFRKLTSVRFDRIFKLDRFMPEGSNIRELSLYHYTGRLSHLNILSLEKLEIVGILENMNLEMLNKRGLIDLTLINTKPRETEHNNSTVLNIPTLRKLKISGMIMNIQQLNKLNLVELVLDDVMPVVEQRKYSYLNIQTLERLNLSNSSVYLGNLPSLRFLDILDSNPFLRYKDNLTNVKNLSSLRIIACTQKSWNKGLKNSTCEAYTVLKIDNVRFPLLRHLEISESINRSNIVIENMPNLRVVSSLDK